MKEDEKIFIPKPEPLTEKQVAEWRDWFRAESDPVNMGFWLPKLEQTGVLVPKTILIRWEGIPLWQFWDNKKPDGIQTFYDEIDKAVQMVGGYPAFLRTGTTSGKHDFTDHCFLSSKDSIPRNAYNLVEDVGMKDVPLGTWVVREFLRLDSTFTAFRGFPVSRERRYFIRSGGVLCHHPYWPEHSIAGQTEEPEWQSKLRKLNVESEEEIAYLTEQSEIVSREFEGAWSLDWACSKDGKWYAIDMAPARSSFHWEGCTAK